MSESHDLFRQLRETLARLFFRRQDAEILAHDAGLDPTRLKWADSAQAFWQSVLEEAELAGLTEDLLARAVARFPHLPALRELRDQYGHWVSADRPGGSPFVLITLPATPRTRELAYLNDLVERYRYWEAKYTPLAGIAEVRTTAQAGLRLDLPSPFMPASFEKLREHGFGERMHVERVPVDDLRTAVKEYRRLVLLGEPGAGKTTTLWRLVYDTASAAQQNPAATLPILVPLGGYSGPEDALAYVQQYAGALAEDLPAYLAAGRVLLLLDGLNELPQTGYGERVGRIQALLDAYPKAPVVVTCRVLDYVETLKLEKLEVKPLEPRQQHAYVCRYLGPDHGEKLFWQMAGADVESLWRTWQAGGATWEQFWTAERMSELIFLRTSFDQANLWQALRRALSDGKLPPMLALGRNPFLLVMLAQVYVAGEGLLPANRGRLFAAFADTLLDREAQRREPAAWPGTDRIKEALGELAYAKQQASERGTAVEHAWAVARLTASVPNPDLALYLAASATLLDLTDGQVRFVHQLIREYFAATAWESRLRAGENVSTHWPDGWFTPSGWEETAILLAGLQADMGWLIERLLLVHPVLAARCIAESGGPRPDAELIDRVQERLVGLATGAAAVRERNAAGDALNILGDPRPGVGLCADGLPDIAWRDVPAGEFVMGNTKETDFAARDDEQPQHRERIRAAFRISRYPITNAQFAAFVRDGGYTDRWRSCWTAAGWALKRERSQPYRVGGAFDLPNHPIVGVTWYEADAFSAWLGRRLGLAVSLPTEAQWERTVRGTDGRRYPWVGEVTPEHANYNETGIGTTTAVGIFPRGANTETGVEDMSGNVWEWCLTKWRANYETPPDDVREGEHRRVLRGGAFFINAWFLRCAARGGDLPYYGPRSGGFRVVAAPDHS